MTQVTTHLASGMRLALIQGMTFHCRFCRQDFQWETASHPLIWSRILVHLGQCVAASWLSRDERSAEARRAAETLLGKAPRSDSRRGSTSSMQSKPSHRH